MSCSNSVTKSIWEALKFAKFEDAEIGDATKKLIEALESDLEAMDFGPSSGDNSVESAMDTLAEAIADYATGDEEEVETEPEDTPDEVVEDDDD